MSLQRTKTGPHIIIAILTSQNHFRKKVEDGLKLKTDKYCIVLHYILTNVLATIKT